MERVEIKDVRLPLQLQRAMAAEAEAAREARAKVMNIQGENIFQTTSRKFIQSSRRFVSRSEVSPAGDRSGGRAEGQRGAEGGGGGDPAVAQRAAAALPPDPHRHLHRAGLHHRVPHAHEHGQLQSLAVMNNFVSQCNKLHHFIH